MVQVWEPQNLWYQLAGVCASNQLLSARPHLPNALTAAVASWGLWTPSTTGNSNADGEPSPKHRSRLPPLLCPAEFYSLHSTQRTPPPENTRLYHTYTPFHQLLSNKPQLLPPTKGRNLVRQDLCVLLNRYNLRLAQSSTAEDAGLLCVHIDAFLFLFLVAHPYG